MEVPAITASFGQPGTCGESRLRRRTFLQADWSCLGGEGEQGLRGGIGDDFKLPEYVPN